MALLSYIDNEVPDFGEWDAVVENAPSSISRSAAASFPERGARGLRVEVDSNAAAYVQKDLPGEQAALAAGFWLRLPEVPAWGPGTWLTLCRAAQTDGGAARMELYLRSSMDGVCLQLYQETAGYYNMVTDVLPLAADRWYYLVAECAWGEQACTARLYLDGALRGEDAAGETGAGCRPDRVQLGCVSAAGVDAMAFDLDEAKLATGYPEPYRPAPAGERPGPKRTVVLFRQGDADSRSFADACVERSDVPRGNLCPLPGAGGDETLADYETFQQQVETDLSAWLDRNPTAADRCTCLLVGYGVPGCFDHGGVRRSTASRLMHLASAFSPGADNPLYAPAKVSRLTKADLGGLWLAARVDAPTLPDALTMLDRAAAVAELDSLPGDDVLFCDEDDYRTSLACQRLRLATAPPDGSFADDAMVWAATGTPSFNEGGTRAAFVDTGDASAASLRTAGTPCGRALHDAGYAAAVGSSDDAETFHAESFFEMLRIGGTFAEAVAVAAAHLDGTAVPAGVPTMAVAMPRAGVNVYHGAGSADAVDYAAPVACLREGQTTAELSLALPEGERHFLAARVVSPAGVEETNTHVITCARADGAGALLDPPLPACVDVTADVLDAESAVVGFSCSPEPGFATPTSFEVLSDAGTGTLDEDNPVATVSPRDDQDDVQATVTGLALPALLVVRARRDGQAGPVSRTVRAAPATPAAPVPL
jgi:hypothetical protein